MNYSCLRKLRKKKLEEKKVWKRLVLALLLVIVYWGLVLGRKLK